MLKILSFIKEHSLLFRVLLIILMVISAFIGIRNTYGLFVDTFGLYGYRIAFSYVYPPLSYLFFNNHMTPTLVMQTFYYITAVQQSNSVQQCESGMVMSSSNPGVCTGIAQTALCLSENNTSLTSFISSSPTNSLYNSLSALYPSCFPSAPPSSPSGIPSGLIGQIFNYGLQILGIVVMIGTAFIKVP